MTGFQLVNATQELASYQTLFTGCEPPDSTQWNQLVWDADTPAGTTIRFAARTADELDGLATATAVPIGAQPPDDSPLDIGEALDAAGVTPRRFLAVEVSLQSAARDAAPVLRQIAMQHSCGVIFQ